MGYAANMGCILKREEDPSIPLFFSYIHGLGAHIGDIQMFFWCDLQYKSRFGWDYTNCPMDFYPQMRQLVDLIDCSLLSPTTLQLNGWDCPIGVFFRVVAHPSGGTQVNGPDVMHSCLPHVCHMTRVFDFRCRESN